MSDGLDEATLKELIPAIRLRIIFKNERMKLMHNNARPTNINKETQNIAHINDLPAG